MPSLTISIKAVALLLATRAFAGCFSAGQAQDYNGDAKTAIQNACNYLSTTNVPPLSTNSTCETVGSNSIKFSIMNTNYPSGDEQVSASDCVAQNTITAQGCSGKGGERNFGKVILTYDPNTGGC